MAKIETEDERRAMESGVEAVDFETIILHAAHAGASAQDVISAIGRAVAVLGEKTHKSAQLVKPYSVIREGSSGPNKVVFTGDNSYEIRTSQELLALADKLLSKH